VDHGEVHDEESERVNDDDAAGTGENAGGGERRRFPRLSKSCSIRVRPLSGMTPDDAGLDAVTVNISGGGLCYQSGHSVAPGSFVAVELQMPDLESPVLALARAAFCSGEASPYEVGLEFWWVGWGDDSAQRAISDLIKSELRQQDLG
jgi:hypothetical protein